MAEINIVNQKNEVVGSRELNAAVFDVEVDAGYIHRVYASLALAQRSGGASTKTRAQVSGGGKKPWKQKGTGRARQGSTRSAQWRHGGVAHGPKGESAFVSRLNRKERRLATRMVLTDAVRNERVTLLNTLDIAEAKTKSFVEVAQALSVSNALYVVSELTREVELSARNVVGAKVVLEGQMNLHDLMKYDRVIVTEAALEKIEGYLS